MEPTLFLTLVPKVPTTDEHPYKQVAVRFDEQKKPLIGSVENVTPRDVTFEGEKARKEQKATEAEGKPSLEGNRSTWQIAHAKAWYESSGTVLTSEEAWQRFGWDGDEVVGINVLGWSLLCSLGFLGTLR